MEKPSSQQIVEFLRSLKHDRDIRNTLDGRRRSEFKKGWAKAVDGGTIAEDTLLDRLTWHNLGFRAGQRFPHADVDTVPDQLELQYTRARRGAG